MKDVNYHDIYDFWFKELTTEHWFKKDKNLDAEITRRFGDIHQQACRAELSSWRDNPYGALSEIILLDQFSRNIFRDSHLSFAFDGMALVLSQIAIEKGFNKNLNSSEKAFLYMPFMHSESLLIHEQAVELFSEKGLEYNFDFELQHKKIIEKFGRYPHRNKILGRQSTSEEIEFLKSPDSSF